MDIQGSVYSKTQPSWMYSDDGKLSAHLTAEHRKLYPDHPKGKPFRVIFFRDGSWLWEYYSASIEEAHQSMIKFVNT